MASQPRRLQCSAVLADVDESKDCVDLMVNPTYYSFAEVRPYLGPALRIKGTYIFIAGRISYNSGHIEEMESIISLARYQHSHSECQLLC
ncbi:hypothetical protein DdX_17619 [Ditylenchus destructor]|uniref:Uncharacterized protein n=1 Tax=Ditylenchus destructor TaxID=166010 RepID=A0AAD4QZ04_9BILA|nr:hypothetical protein DdX_17619 [Ditylenchus destructor]